MALKGLKNTLVKLSLLLAVAIPGLGVAGENDLGAISQLGPEQVLIASKLIKTGKTYPLAITTGVDTPTIKPRYYRIEVFQANEGKPIAANRLTVNDDIVHSGMGIGTQIDGLGHIGTDGVFYGGHKMEDFVRDDGLTALSVANLPPLVTRGVLLDVAGYLGRQIVPEATVIDSALIKNILAHQQLTLRAGDIVMFNTGWQSLMYTDKERFSSRQPGLVVDGANYLVAQGVVAVGADTPALELVPALEYGQAYPVHQTLLTNNGVYILENLYTKELASDRVYEFFLTIGVPKLSGSVQAIINPVAIY